MKNFKKFLFLPDMVREEEETSSADTRDEETTLEDVWVAAAERRMCPVQRSLVTGHWSLVMIQIYLQTTARKPQDSTKW